MIEKAPRYGCSYCETVLGRLDVQRAQPSDVGEILTVQRAAYVSEAQLYGDASLPSLLESAEDIKQAITPPVHTACHGQGVHGLPAGSHPGCGGSGTPFLNDPQWTYEAPAGAPLRSDGVLGPDTSGFYRGALCPKCGEIAGGRIRAVS